MPIPSTSTTLLRQMAADSRHVRWGEFVRRYQPMMEEYLRIHFPGLEAEDIISEALIALVDVLKNYRYAPDETGSFHNYLTGILKHKALYRRRASERHEKCRAAFEDSTRRVDDSSAIQAVKLGGCKVALLHVSHPASFGKHGFDRKAFQRQLKTVGVKLVQKSN